MAKLYIGNTAYKVMLGDNSGHIADLPTIVWNQLAQSLEKHYSNVINEPFTSNNINVIQGHKYYMSWYQLNVMPTAGRNAVYVGSALQTPTNLGMYETPRGYGHRRYIKTAGSNGKGKAMIWTAPPEGEEGYANNLHIIDLTLMFGDGNEPTSVEQFEQWFTDNIGSLDNYYPYNAGEEIKVKYLPKYM